MIKSESEKSYENVCDFRYLTEMTGKKKHFIKEIIDVFLKQVTEELQSINDAIKKADYEIIKSNAHAMRSSVSIMGISVLAPVLREMENLGAMAADGPALLTTSIEKIKELNKTLNLICKQAFEEIEKEKLNYV